MTLEQLVAGVGGATGAQVPRTSSVLGQANPNSGSPVSRGKAEADGEQSSPPKMAVGGTGSSPTCTSGTATSPGTPATSSNSIPASGAESAPGAPKKVYYDGNRPRDQIKPGHIMGTHLTRQRSGYVPGKSTTDVRQRVRKLSIAEAVAEKHC